jgi:hypothetical protein
MYTKEEQKQIAKALLYFISFCKNCLIIRDIKGNLVPFIPNRAQRRFFEAIMKQYKEKGYIRVVICKARKMGFSTLIIALFLWVLLTHTDKEALTGTHHEDTNAVMMEIFNRFVDNLPEELQQNIASRNSSTVKLGGIDCTYNVLAASNTTKVGRGFTGQYLHISEIAHIIGAENLAMSLLSAVGHAVKGTVIILESTANGINNYHHSVYIGAKNGENDYIPFFAPWFEDDRYRLAVPDNFILNDEEQAYRVIYPDVDDEQMYWRRMMIASGGLTYEEGLAAFKQEYPSNDIEAFQASTIGSFIPVNAILDAMQREPYHYSLDTAIYAGFDPSHTASGDAKGYCARQGMNVIELENPQIPDIDRNFSGQINFCKAKLDNNTIRLRKLFIDAGGGGYEIEERLREDGYGNRVELVNFGGDAEEVLKFKDRRAEMSYRVKEALLDKTTPLYIAYNQKLIAEMTVERWTEEKGKTIIEPKKKVKERCGYDPALYDALRLTFARRISYGNISSGVRMIHVEESDSLLERVV